MANGLNVCFCRGLTGCAQGLLLAAFSDMDRQTDNVCYGGYRWTWPPASENSLKSIGVQPLSTRKQPAGLSRFLDVSGKRRLAVSIARSRYDLPVRPP